MTTDVSVTWFLARTSGLVAEGALLGATLCGLGVAGALPFLDRKRSFELHEVWTLAAWAFTTLHLVVVGIDGTTGIPVGALLVPFLSPVARGALALGTLAAWGLGLVTVTTSFRSAIPPAAWRALHAVAYATFVFVVAHGLFAGTDAQHPLVLAFHGLAVASVVAASVWRAVQGAAG